MSVVHSNSDSDSVVGTISVCNDFDVKRQDIDYLLVAAFEGGITYWCDQIKIDGDWPENADYASDCLSRGVDLMLHDYEENHWHRLTLPAFLSGVKLAMEQFNCATFEQFMDEHDASYADIAVQFAIFEEIMYG